MSSGELLKLVESGSRSLFSCVRFMPRTAAEPSGIGSLNLKGFFTTFVFVSKPLQLLPTAAQLLCFWHKSTFIISASGRYNHQAVNAGNPSVQAGKCARKSLTLVLSAQANERIHQVSKWMSTQGRREIFKDSAKFAK